jgi:hypothetical protein
MARITDANLMFSGGEPKFSTELSKVEMMKTLNWYSQNKTSKDAEKWAQDYFKKKLKVDVSDALKSAPDTFGYVCRIVMNGGSLDVKNLTWFENQIKEITENSKKPKKKVVVKDDNAVPTVTIQDRIREKAHECIGELEGQLDEYVVSDFKADANPYAIMHTLNIKSVHVKMIVDFAKKRRSEFDEVLNTTDKELKEAYSNFTKPQLKKIIAWCDQIILDSQKVMGAAQQNRKPRKRKVKSPEELVAKIKVLDKYDDLKLVSIATKDIVGALQLWVYNVKQRKLGCYHAEDAGGLTVKGTTITNFNETKSIQKRLRKPEVTLPEVLKGGKVALRNLLDGVKAVESPLTGRVNGDIILVRILK